MIHVGVSGPGAVRAALAKLPKDAPMDEVAELVKRTAFKITRLGQLVANLASERLGVPAGHYRPVAGPDARRLATVWRTFWRRWALRAAAAAARRPAWPC